MNLQTHIRDDLWLAVQSTYEAGNYSEAILDAMHHLSSVLRDRAGVDGDGAALVGQALGGDSPRLRINKLQTETEKNVQRGIESILRGMYQAIRNPRSHADVKDTQETASAVIYFIEYLLGIIRGSEEPFVLSRFLARVFDSDFVRSQRYAELLVNEVPTNKRFDALVTLYRQKFDGDINNVGLVVRALVAKLSDEQLTQYLAIVSDELAVITEEQDICYNLLLLPPDLWRRMSELSRLRIENRVIRSIKEGVAVYGTIKRGALATWASSHFEHFTLRDQVGAAFLEKLDSDDRTSQHYVGELFLVQLPNVILEPYRVKQAVQAISKAIREDDQRMRQALVDSIYWLPSDWQKAFVEALKDLTDESHPLFFLTDGTPFLSSDNLECSVNSDDIPF